MFKVTRFHILLNTIVALCITLASYIHVPLNSTEGRLMYFFHLLITQASFAGVLYLLTLNRLVFKIIFSSLFLLLGFIAFWVYTINISISQALIEATLTSKSYIIKDLFSLQLIIVIIVMILVLWFILRQYKSIQPTKGIKLFLPLSLVLITLFFYADYKRTNSFRSKLPYALFYAIGEHFTKDDTKLKQTPKIVDEEKLNNLKIVLVLGESLRADHLSLNGYPRETTPMLSKRNNVISFNNVFTNKGNTALSLPCILTDQSIYSEDKDSLQSIFSVYNALDVPTFWIGNQLLETSYKSIVETNESVEIIDKLKSYWNINKKQDLQLLPSFKDKIRTNSKGLFTLHMIGSHWWYEDKYTENFRKFKPIIEGKYIPSLEKQEIINSYDNTILYLDNFLNEVISTLEKDSAPTVMIYISDHGESLGENGRWLHSHSEGLTKPGMIVWYSEKFKTRFPNKTSSLIKNKNKELSTDIIFHSLIDLSQTKTLDFDLSKSIFFNGYELKKENPEQ
ncbi:phosphoethanolamine transferase [Ichthyenterobacterium sp. W332]|uniref:Phosphoethanolamine transferase n=1 Tax=Microcosmobacter mediterraneus TaxID=3075607 RepID=A0ABU2YL99_9FLAO|nr:phosphoethanolamine transferase [Ichthyenterobacterium sp. W332]MDT0558025.1 phosphoethanolamine transferase [Ichthyenterobacterium sp. W332]